jgi:hypothetical protein
MRQAVSSIAIAAAGLLASSWGATLASAASAAAIAKPPRPPEPLIVIARANVPAFVPVPVSDIVTTPPALLAQTIVPVAPAPALAVTSAAITPGSTVRAVTPGGPQPGVFWILAMGAVLYRVGARFLRVS